MPFVTYPVFKEGSSGKIEPHKMMWPAYWARLDSSAIVPLLPEVVKSLVGKTLFDSTRAHRGAWPVLPDSQLTDALIQLSKSDTSAAFGYVTGGDLYTVVDSTISVHEDHSAGAPYSWALAHNVRPAQQSLGVRSCMDCHAPDAPFYFGQIDVATPVMDRRGQTMSMSVFQDGNYIASKLFAYSFYARPIFKWLLLLATAVMGLVLLRYSIRLVSHYLENAKN